MTEAQAGLLVLLAIPVLWALMWWGWRRRARRQQDLPAPPLAPQDPGPALLGPREGVYVSSTTSGDWLDRVVAHGLGRRSACDVAVFDAGVSVAREGEDVLWLPADRLLRVRRERGMAGKYVDREGLVVITWLLGPGDELELDTGLRLRHGDDADALVTALAELLARGPARGPAGADGGHERDARGPGEHETDEGREGGQR
ncbi:transporter [uncultured Pseudokineococcus sp.]|uniref:PH-like domain-containing protein n=1 Tax=uncultured Pseudokineococcus sp. TaxID=1642928 RepID=UPI00260D53BF|nr:transporter [uncultured Pseudokineococcus sp.]